MIENIEHPVLESRDKYIKHVYAQWEKFLSNESPGNIDVRPEIYSSWKRSLDAGISFDDLCAPQIWNHDQLAEHLAQFSDLITAAEPTISEISKILEHTNQVINLLSPDAIVLDTRGSAIGVNKAKEYNLMPGSGIAEEHQGTTASGLVKITGNPVSITGHEAYSFGASRGDSIAAPILDISCNKLAGIISICGVDLFNNVHAVGLVISSARNIDQRLYEQYLNRKAALMVSYQQALIGQRANILIALDINGHVIECTSRYHPLLTYNGTTTEIADELSEWIEPLLKTKSDSNVISPRVFGDYNVMCKPIFSNNAFCGILLSIFEKHSLNKSLKFGKTDQKEIEIYIKEAESNGLIGTSDVFLKTLQFASRIGRSNVTVHIYGETGVGKECIAKMIHNVSNRHDHPFIAVNCGAIPKDLIAGELFGYIPGAFTSASNHGNKGKLESANGGTLFLDEIGELPLEAQTYLLRVLQEKEVVRLGSSKAIPVDIRIISASNTNLRELVKRKLFREDLYFRINVADIEIPPLRERIDDLPYLIPHFMKMYGASAFTVNLSTLNVMAEYSWPGNIRELMNFVQNVIALDEDIDVFAINYIKRMNAVMTEIGNVDIATDVINSDTVRAAIIECNGNISKAAKRLNVARTTVYRYIKKQDEIE